MPTLRESRTPNIPHRSPFRIRDSQMSKMQHVSNADRWSFSMELVNMWNMKPLETFNEKRNEQSENLFSSGNLLTQLLVSQAILDSNEFQILSFEKLDKLKKQYVELHEHIKNITKSIHLENRIKNISKSLANVNLKNSRNSILYLENQRQDNDHKISQLTAQLEDMKSKEIAMKKTILQHTAGVLSKGIQKIESAPQTSTFSSHYHDKAILLDSELDQISNRVDFLLSRYCSYTRSIPDSSVEKISLLDQHLSQQKHSLKEGKSHKADQIKGQLIEIEHERNSLLSKLVDLEIKSTKMLATLSSYSNRQRALKLESLQYKGESIELQIWDRLRKMDADTGQNIPTPKQDPRYEQQLKDQSEFYTNSIQQQTELLEKNSRMCDQLQIDCSKLKSVKLGLDNLVREKSRILDDKDNQISRLNADLRTRQHQAQKANNAPYRPENRDEKEKMKKQFLEKEARWTEHTHNMEDRFDELLENFDKLTNTAIEFDSSRMKFDRTIDNLNGKINKLEVELLDEKVHKIGYSQGESPTTASLRKEFRLLVAEMKNTHQTRMDREAQEIHRLQSQLEELQNTGSDKYVRSNTMAIQTDL